MDGIGLGTIVLSVLGAGGLSGVIQAYGTYRSARQQQPVDQWAQLAATLQGMIIQSEKNCAEKYDRLLGEHKACMEGHVALTEQVGELRGRLDEQRHMLSVTVQHTKANTEKIELVSDATRDKK